MISESEGFGREHTDPELFQQFESELSGTEARAEAAYLLDITDTAAGIKASLEKLVPGFEGMKFTPVHEQRPSYANGGGFSGRWLSVSITAGGHRSGCCRTSGI